MEEMSSVGAPLSLTALCRVNVSRICKCMEMGKRRLGGRIDRKRGKKGTKGGISGNEQHGINEGI